MSRRHTHNNNSSSNNNRFNGNNPNKSGGSGSSGNSSQVTAVSSGSSGSASSPPSHSLSPSNNSSTATTGHAKWAFSWRKLRTCFLQPYQSTPPPLGPSSSNGRPPHPLPLGGRGGCGSSDLEEEYDVDESHMEGSHREGPLVLLGDAAPLAPPPPPGGDDAGTIVAYPNLPSSRESPSDNDEDDDTVEQIAPHLTTLVITENDARLGKEGLAEEEVEEDLVSATESESLDASSVVVMGTPTREAKEPAPAVTLGAQQRPGPVRRTVTEAPSSSKVRALDLVPGPAPAAAVAAALGGATLSEPALEAKERSSDGGGGAPSTSPRLLNTTSVLSGESVVAAPSTALASISRPGGVRRGCSVPLSVHPPSSLGSSFHFGAPTSPKTPSPDSSAATRLLPPKAPPAGGPSLSGRPQGAVRRTSSTAAGAGAVASGHRPRLGSTHTNATGLTNSSRHRRQNNSFEFSVDSLQRIGADPSPSSSPDESANTNHNNPGDPNAPKGRQSSEQSWSTMPMSSITFGVLERDCSELVTDEWEVDSLVMSSDGDDEDDHQDDDDDAESGDQQDADGKEPSASPSPTSVLDEAGAPSRGAEGAPELPDWMLQWAQQPPSTPEAVKAKGKGPSDPPGRSADGDDSFSSCGGEDEMTHLTEDVDPQYLPAGPRPDGCTYSAYMAACVVAAAHGTPSHPSDDAHVSLVQVVAGKLVVGRGTWEVPLERDTRVQSLTPEDDPRRRVVVVRHPDAPNECHLFPLLLVPAPGGKYRRPSRPIRPRLSFSGSLAVVPSADVGDEDLDGPSQAVHSSVDWSADAAAEDDASQCEAALHLVFFLDACCRQAPAPSPSVVG